MINKKIEMPQCNPVKTFLFISFVYKTYNSSNTQRKKERKKEEEKKKK